MCEQMGRITQATVCDHIKPHKGNEALFFDPANLSSLCKLHHDSAKQRAERRGEDVRVTGLDGWPVG